MDRENKCPGLIPPERYKDHENIERMKKRDKG